MKVLSTLALVTALGTFAAAQPAATQSAAPAASQEGSAPVASPENNASAPVIGAVLAKTIDAKKAKQGDEVVAKTMMDMKSVDGTVFPANSKITGHVTQVQARGKGQDQSVLAITFDKLQGKDKELPFHAVIQAVAPPPPIVAPGPDSSPSGPGTGGTSGAAAAAAAAKPEGSSTRDSGSSGAMGSNAGAVENSGAAAGAQDPGASLTTKSQGVIGIKNLQLAPAASGSSQGSMLTSTSSNVKLESGTRLVLKVTPQ